jgi:hypothetical protein
MVSTVFPKILYNHYFWLIVAFCLIIAIRFTRRKSPPPFPGARKSIKKFCKEHEKSIKIINDTFWVFSILLLAFYSLFMLNIFRTDFSSILESEPFRIKSLQSKKMFLFSILIIWSGISGFFVGFLSVFQSNITNTKRTILLIVCLLPVVFTIIQVLTGYTENLWSTVQLCLLCSAGCWIMNMPAVLVGKNLSELSGKHT